MDTPTKQSASPLNNAAYLGIALLLGGLTALVGGAFHEGVSQLGRVYAGLSQTLTLAAPWSYLLMALVSASAFCLAVAIVRRFAPEASGSGVQEVEGAMAGERYVRWHRVLPVKFIGGLLSLGAGLVGGREGPTIHMGASLAQALVERFRLSGADAKALLGAGAAAGLTAAFSAPVASVLFIIEEARGTFPYSKRTYHAVIAAAAACGVLTIWWQGGAPFMAIHAQTMPVSFLWAFVLLGALLGGVGVLFNRVILFSLDAAARLSQHVSPYVLPACLGIMIGPLILWFPQATGGGEHVVEVLVQHPLSIGMLGLLVVARFVMTASSYAAGAPAGIFAPILALAVVVSLFVGNVLALFVSVPDGAMVAFAVAGMAGLFASSIRAPMVGVVLIIELTGAHAALMPSLLCAATAAIVAMALGGQPIYDQLLQRTLRLAQTEALAHTKTK